MRSPDPFPPKASGAGPSSSTTPCWPPRPATRSPGRASSRRSRRAPAARRLPHPQPSRGGGAARRGAGGERSRHGAAGEGAARARSPRRADERRASRRRRGGRPPRHRGRGVQRFAAPKIASPNTHGTGCTLSSAIAAQIVRALPLAEAVAAAKAFVPRRSSGAGAQGSAEGRGRCCNPDLFA